MQTRERTQTRRTRPIVARVRHPFGGGVDGNDHLTALTGAVLLLLLAVEGGTIPFLGALLTVHIFVGLLLLGPVALKLASTGYRFLRYYGGTPAYVHRGPPTAVMRVIVAPVLVLSTLTLFGTGVGLVVVGHGGGLMSGLHKASFIVWFGAMAIHVLIYTTRALSHSAGDFGRRRLRGAGIRLTLLFGALALGVVIALVTMSLSGHFQHWDN